jgi:hypothetical protein
MPPLRRFRRVSACPRAVSRVAISSIKAVRNQEGWTGYDPKAPGYTRDEIRAERDRLAR